MNPIFVAIDTPDMDRARALAKAVAPLAGGLKLGLEFFCHNGRAGVTELAATGLPIFVDLKFHDIPNTVAGAIQALGDLTPAVLTVHAAGGRAMMEDAKAAAPAATKVVAVTLLTSLDRDDLSSIGVAGQPSGQVERLAELARVALYAGASILVIGRPITAAADPAAALRAIAATL